MVDQNAEENEIEEQGNTEREGEEYAVERVVTREEGATVLRGLADGVVTGSVVLGRDEITVTVPERFALEIEYERGTEEGELEVELEWSMDDGAAVTPEHESATRRDSEGADTEVPAGDETGESDEDAGSGADTGVGTPLTEFIGPGNVASKASFELYRDRAGAWRWRLVHTNGNVIADSGQGYDRKAKARDGLRSVMRNAPGAPVVEIDE